MRRHWPCVRMTMELVVVLGLLFCGASGQESSTPLPSPNASPVACGFNDRATGKTYDLTPLTTLFTQSAARSQPGTAAAPLCGRALCVCVCGRVTDERTQRDAHARTHAQTQCRSTTTCRRAWSCAGCLAAAAYPTRACASAVPPTAPSTSAASRALPPPPVRQARTHDKRTHTHTDRGRRRGGGSSDERRGGVQGGVRGGLR
jgi:hypothetical protein